MINEGCVQKYCRDDISKIENYDKAIADTTQTWHLHHRLELTLDGEFAHTPEELMRLDMYFNRPYFELVFLTPEEHHRLHKKGKQLTEESRMKMSVAKKGTSLSDETKRKMSIAKKGRKCRPFTTEHRQNLSAAHKGKRWKLVDGRRVWY